ncbi:DUF6841 family protein [Inhella inkyongensis]|nr:hypothetical protein [Inhella inkyongensis]
MQLHDIEAFFKAYADAFNDLSGDAVAAHWASPSAIASGEAVTWWPTHEPMADNMRRLCAVYREAGFEHCRFEVLQATPMGAHDAFALLRWTLTRQDGALLQRFSTGYHLHRSGGRTKVLLCTAFDEDLAAMRANSETQP